VIGLPEEDSILGYLSHLSVIAMAADEQKEETAPQLPPLPEKIQHGLNASVKYLVSTFLQEKHYSMIGTALASKWDKFQSLSAAMKLMEQHGVTVPKEEQQRLEAMGSEAQMIEALVMKMPQQSQEKFQHFFLQLQLIVSTATRIRQALEQGKADLVEQAMDDADSTGVSQYILKMAIVQAGAEVTNLKKQHKHFVKDAAMKLSKLVHGQEDVMAARQRLQKAQGELAMFQTQQNEAIKKVLMTFAGGSSSALLHGCFSSWGVYVKRMRVENLIYEEYREEIEKAEQRLIDAKSEQLSSVKGMIEKNHKAMTENLCQEVFNLWKEDVEEHKQNLATADQVAEMEAKLKACQDHQAQSAKKVLARCGAASEQGLRDMCFHEWLAFHQEYLKNKEFEDKVKEEEKRIAEFMKGKSQGAQSVLTKMSEATDSGLIYTCFTSWAEYYKEEKRAAEFAEQMAGAQGKFGAFGERNKKSAKNAMERSHEHQLTMLYLKIWGAWKLETRMEQLMKKNQARIEGKRHQLLGVQSMFRDFAVKLESNIAQSADSNREPLGPPPSTYKKQYNRGMTRTEQTVSLPDIHSR
jgi:hypothetical protein